MAFLCQPHISIGFLSELGSDLILLAIILCQPRAIEQLDCRSYTPQAAHSSQTHNTHWAD